MNWFKENPFLGGLAAGTAVLALALLYWLWTGLDAYALADENFQARTGELAALYSAKPFPSAENVRQAEADATAFEKLLGEVGERLTDGEQLPPLEDITPEQFQDRVRAAVDKLAASAAAKGAVLGPEFHLGFGAYQAQLPSPAAAPALAQQLASIEGVCRILVETGVKELSSVTRQPLPVEQPEPANPGRPAPPKAPANKLPEVRFDSFDVNFIADQASFRDAFNKIVVAKPLVFVRLVRLENSKPTPPPKNTAEAEAAPATEQTGEPEKIPAVLGQETVHVTLRLSSVALAESPRP